MAKKCATCGERTASFRGLCMQCNDAKEIKGRSERLQLALASIIVTTESTHNLPVSERLGIVSAEIVVGMNIFKDFQSGVRNIVGGRTGNIQSALRDIREQAIE